MRCWLARKMRAKQANILTCAVHFTPPKDEFASAEKLALLRREKEEKGGGDT